METRKIDKIQYMNDEELIPCIRFFLDLCNYKVIRVLVYLGTVVTILISLWQTYYLLYHFKVQYFLKYSPFMLGTTYSSIALCIYIYGYHSFSPQIENFRKNFYWSIKMASPSTRKRIIRGSYQTRYMNRIQIVLIESACVCVAYRLITDSTNCFAPSVVMAKYSLGLNKAFCWMFAVLICLGVFPLFLSVWHAYYVLLYLKHQISILIDMLYGKVNLVPTTNGKEDVSKVFESILKRHYEITEFFNKVESSCYALGSAYVIGGQLIALYTVFYIFSSDAGWFITSSSMCTYVFGAWQVAFECQKFEDTIEELAVAFYSIKWYNWDLKTMKSYMIAHQYISKERMKIPVVSILQGNFEQLKKGAQLWFTVFNFYYSQKKSMSG